MEFELVFGARDECKENLTTVGLVVIAPLDGHVYDMFDSSFKRNTIAFPLNITGCESVVSHIRCSCFRNEVNSFSNSRI